MAGEITSSWGGRELLQIIGLGPWLHHGGHGPLGRCLQKDGEREKGKEVGSLLSMKRHQHQGSLLFIPYV